MHTNVFNSLPALTQKNLAAIAVAVEDVVPIETSEWRFLVSTLPARSEDVELLQTLSTWAGKSTKCLYTLHCVTPSVDLNDVDRAFVIAKGRANKLRAYPKINSKSACFYVGQSKAIRKRMCEHLGFRAKGTYALQLIHWARELDLDLMLTCAKYPESTPETVLQALEDTLWDELTPMFGRQGKR